MVISGHVFKMKAFRPLELRTMAKKAIYKEVAKQAAPGDITQPSRMTKLGPSWSPRSTHVAPSPSGALYRLNVGRRLRDMPAGFHNPRRRGKQDGRLPTMPPGNPDSLSAARGRVRGATHQYYPGTEEKAVAFIDPDPRGRLHTAVSFRVACIVKSSEN